MTSGQIPWRKVVVGCVVGVVLLWVLPVTWVGAATFTLIGGVMLLSIIVVTGFAGQVSLAQWSIAGCGALVTAQLVVHGFPFWAAILVGAAVGLPIGLVVGLVALRTRGFVLAIATLAFSLCVVSLLLSNDSLNGGSTGLAIGSFHLFGLDLDAVDQPRRYALFALVVFVLIALALVNLRRGVAGRRLLAVRANERAAASLGVNVLTTKVAGFCYGAVIAAIGGVLTALLYPSVLFTSFSPQTSINLVSNAVIGGVGFPIGSLIGGSGQSGALGYQVLKIISSNDVQYLTLIFGALTVLVIMRSPDGIVPLQARDFARMAARLRKLLRRPARPPHRSATIVATERSAVPAMAVDGALLEVKGLTVEFGGVRALDQVSFSLRSGEILGVIGPNGAGKSTLCDAVTGFTAPRRGTIVFNGTDLTRLSARSRSRLGIGRSFQSLELFEDMTVYENILVACDRGEGLAWLRDAVRPGRPRLSPSAVAAVEQLGLRDHLGDYPSALSHGKRRLLAMARTVARNVDIVLLDEPCAGLDERERAEFAEIVTRLAHEWGAGVLLIEHDVDLVTATSDRMIALDFGKVIARGSPSEVRGNPEVQRSYLGTDDEPVDDDQEDGGGTGTTAPALVEAAPAVAGAVPTHPGRPR